MKYSVGLLSGLLASLALAVAPPPRADEIPDFIKGADGLEDALRNLKASMVTTPVLPPAEAHRRFKPRPGLKVDLIAAEPVVKQPLHVAFDERGRLWVTQYRQYPFPAGLKVVEYDRYIRAKFDRVPPPPPDHFPGSDRITIHEDVKGDGSFSKVTTFLDGLNIATAALPGKGGVWVMNPPYLLFYPATDDKPGRPVVHLSGFGLEDTHAVASSLTWGPDGWIYGAQGSTCTAKVKVEVTREKTTTDFLGQAIWRYHPTKHLFEVFAEGGGNTFGVAFDDVGRVYSGTNWGKYRGLHYVQGGYYIKGWGKHGPLTNPYALGYFEHMPHEGDADRLTHTFIVYGEQAIPELRGKIVGVNALQRRLQVTQLHADRSTFRTVEEPFLVTTDDGRFRPVDVKAGPDGALYVADMYEPRINHVDPRDNWDKATGRVWRVRPDNYRPQAAPYGDVKRATRQTLTAMLTADTRWHRDTARRILGEREDLSAAADLRGLLREPGQTALEALWAIHQSEGVDDRTALLALGHANPHVRRWAVRLVGDELPPSVAAAEALTRLAAEEKDPEVRSQLASSAKRLPAAVCLAILDGLWRHDGDVNDPHIPMLTWWALEAKAESARVAVVRLLSDEAVRARPVVAGFILERIMQRWAMAGGEANFLACAALLDATPKADALLTGLEKGFGGGSAGAVPDRLRRAVFAAWGRGTSAAKLTLGLRLGHEPAVKQALAAVTDDKASLTTRQSVLKILGEIELPAAVAPLLTVLEKSPALRPDALAALSRHGDDAIAKKVIALGLAKSPEGLALLAGRPAWAKLFLAEVAAKRLDARAVPFDVVQKLALHAELADDVTKHFGRVRGSTTKEKQAALIRYAAVLKKGKGDARAGAAVFKAECGKCHKLFGDGGNVGPELTGYERSNVMYWLENVTDPSAVIREEYLSFVVRTKNGQTLTGIISGQDKTTVTLKDQEGRETKLARSRI
ncbi:MAG: DUF7133 domain-containing protein, partial [Gemmataceae bacterium]